MSFETLWESPTGAFSGRPFPSSGVELKAWCREAFELGAKEERDACLSLVNQRHNTEDWLYAAIRKRGEK